MSTKQQRLQRLLDRLENVYEDLEFLKANKDTLEYLAKTIESLELDVRES